VAHGLAACLVALRAGPDQDLYVEVLEGALEGVVTFKGTTASGDDKPLDGRALITSRGRSSF